MLFRSRALLELDGGASGLELLLGLLGVFLLGLLENSLRSRVDQGLGLDQAKGGEGADGHDDLNLLDADGGEDDVELVLLLLGRGGGTGNGGNGGDRAAASTSNFSSKALTNSESSTRVISPKASSRSSLVYSAMMASSRLLAADDG